MAEPLNMPSAGIVGICLGAGQCKDAAYHTDIDGRMVFSKEFGVFASQSNFEAGDAVVFNFKNTNAGGMNMICVVHSLKMPVE